MQQKTSRGAVDTVPKALGEGEKRRENVKRRFLFLPSSETVLEAETSRNLPVRPHEALSSALLGKVVEGVEVLGVKRDELDVVLDP